MRKAASQCDRLMPPLWAPLVRDCHLHIDFAYRTFRWDSEESYRPFAPRKECIAPRRLIYGAID